MTEYNDLIDMGLNDVEGWDGKTTKVDPGEYIFEVEKVSVDQSKKGNPTLACNFRVISEGPMKGRPMRQSYALMTDNEFSRRRMKALVQALGVQLGENGEFSAQSLIGCQMQAEVIMNEYMAVDPRSGQQVPRQSAKIVGEKPVEGAAAPTASAPAAAPAGAAPKNAPIARRAAPATAPAPVTAPRR
jgi:hypothetical protein